MKKQSYLKYIMSVFMFGSNGIIASFIALDSLQIVLLRTFLGSILLLFLFLITGGKFTFHKKLKQFVFLLVSGTAMGISWMLLYEAYTRVGVSIATLLYYCGPVIVMILSPIVFKEKMTATKITGFILVVVGVFFVNGQLSTEEKDSFGIVCALLSAVTYSFMVMFNKKAKDITGIENSLLQLIISFLTVFCIIGLKQGMVFHVAAESIVPILVLGLINTGIGCYFYFSSIDGLPVQSVAVLGYIEPLSAVFLSAIFLNEKMTPFQILGGGLILGGAMLGELLKTKDRKRRM